MSFDKHVSEICKASYFHIRALRHIRSSLTTEAAKTIAVAIVGSRLDYCNSLLAGHIHIKSCSPSDGPEHPCSSCCTKVSVLPYHASSGRPALATCSPSNWFQNCHNCFQGTAPPAAFIPCSNSHKIHTFTITPVLFFYNHICTI